MRFLQTKIKKTIRCKVLASSGQVKIKFPKQTIGCIALEFDNAEKKILLRQWELVLIGDNLQTVRIK